jgi:hypothetical protein
MIALTIGFVLVAWGARGPYRRFLAAYWLRQLHSAADDRAGSLVEAIARVGDPGIPVLVELLGSERACVASASRQALDDLLDGWARLPARQYSPKLAKLAQALAGRVDQFGPTARAHAADLAARILRLWRYDPAVVAPVDLIAACETVLRAAEDTTIAARDLDPAAGLVDVAPAVDRASDPIRRRALRGSAGVAEAPEALLRHLSPVPGGGLPFELPSPGHLAEDPASSPEEVEAGASDRPRQEVATDVRPVSRGDGPRSEGRRAPLDVSTLGTVDLMRRLQSPIALVVDEARSELVRRGFLGEHLELADRMFHPDPEVRMELVRALPESPHVDAAPWLLQLAQDENARVRQAAMALMATTNDPAMLDAMERMARDDRDPEVHGQAERIGQRRRGRLH